MIRAHRHGVLSGDRTERAAARSTYVRRDLHRLRRHRQHAAARLHHRRGVFERRDRVAVQLQKSTQYEIAYRMPRQSVVGVADI